MRPTPKNPGRKEVGPPPSPPFALRRHPRAEGKEGSDSGALTSLRKAPAVLPASVAC